MDDYLVLLIILLPFVLGGTIVTIVLLAIRRNLRRVGIGQPPFPGGMYGVRRNSDGSSPFDAFFGPPPPRNRWRTHNGGHTGHDPHDYQYDQGQYGGGYTPGSHHGHDHHNHSHSHSHDHGWSSGGHDSGGGHSSSSHDSGGSSSSDSGSSSSSDSGGSSSSSFD